MRRGSVKVQDSPRRPSLQGGLENLTRSGWTRDRRDTSLRSVGNLVGSVEPKLERFPGWFAEERGAGDGALLGGTSEFAVEEGVVEGGAGRVGAGVAVPDAIHAGPVDGREAHGAGLTTGIDFAAFERESGQGLAGGADGADFGVGGGIVLLGDAVGCFADEDAGADNDGAEGSALAGADVFRGERDGATHEFRVGRAGKVAHGRGKPQSVWHTGNGTNGMETGGEWLVVW
jgi:hypothetical protein